MNSLKILEYKNWNGEPIYYLKGVFRFFNRDIESPKIIYLGWSGNIFGNDPAKFNADSLSNSVKYKTLNSVFREEYPFLSFLDSFCAGNFSTNIDKAEVDLESFDTGKIYAVFEQDILKFNFNLGKHYKKWSQK